MSVAAETLPTTLQSYELQSDSGALRCTISNLGARWLSAWVPDRDGQWEDVLLGYAQLQDYRHDSAYFGAIVGPWANRIAQGRFELDGQTIQLQQNQGSNHLHGGDQGLHAHLWQCLEQGPQHLRLGCSLPASRSGYPADVRVEVTYRIVDSTLHIHYQAEVSARCPLNLTAHPYFNLAPRRGDIGQHWLQIHAGHYLAVDEQLIPQREEAVDGSLFDLRQPQQLVTLLAPLTQADCPRQLQLGAGLDHCWLPEGQGLREVAVVYEPLSGRQLRVSSDQPGLQCYTGNYLADIAGKQGHYRNHDGFCLEAQALPDQVNSPRAAACIYSPEHPYRQHSCYQFTTRSG